MKYFKNIQTASATTLKGLLLSIKYFFDARKKRPQAYLEDKSYFDQTEGTFTVQYPYEEIPIPDHGRYKLHNEIDDCIVCDKCAKVCPVDCIDIEPVRATETFGHTSDGTPLKIYPAKFDIDMSKCCFCGLCTVVCPTECLTMTKEYDFSTENILDHNFSFSKMTEQQIADKKQEFETFQAKKQEAAATAKATVKPRMKPAIKPAVKSTEATEERKTEGAKKPVFKPRIPTQTYGAKKPVFKPRIPPKTKQIENTESETSPKTEGVKKPVMKPRIPGKTGGVKRPVIKPKIPSKTDEPEKPVGESENPPREEGERVKKPVIKPRIPPRKS